MRMLPENRMRAGIPLVFHVLALANETVENPLIRAKTRT